MSSLLPTHRDASSSSSLHVDPNATQVDLRAPASEHSASTQVGGDDDKDLKKSASPKQEYNEKSGGSSNEAYIDKGFVDIDFEEGKRKVQVIVEQKSGKELIKELSGGPYTQPRWYVCIFHFTTPLPVMLPPPFLNIYVIEGWRPMASLQTR